MPVYIYECLACCHYFEELRPLDSDPKGCPKCGGTIARRPAPSYSIYRGEGFYASEKRAGDKMAISASGQLAHRVSRTEDSDLGTKVDKKGYPQMSPTRPRNPLG